VNWLRHGSAVFCFLDWGLYLPPGQQIILPVSWKCRFAGNAVHCLKVMHSSGFLFRVDVVPHVDVDLEWLGMVCHAMLKFKYMYRESQLEVVVWR
jgi:hypothetical protein